MVKKKKKAPAKAPRKKVVKAKKTTARSKSREMIMEQVGEVTHYFGHVKAAAVKLIKSGMAVGDKIYLKGHTTDFKDKVRSIQLNNEPLALGKKGQEIGLSVKSRVRIGDKVYKV